MWNSNGYFTRPVEGRHAPRYMLIMVIAFAIAVVATRGYLELTGYPQLGNETFHIAHALWGGLLLLVASSLSLIYLNEWFFALSAALTGIGVGLFIDEIGKFITQSNDYFSPLAAPIIYVVYVLIVLAYLVVRHQERLDARGEMYQALDELKPLLDQRLDATQHARLIDRLQRVARQTERADLAALAQALLVPIQAHEIERRPGPTGPVGRLLAWLKGIEARRFTQPVMRRLLTILLLWLGVVSVVKISFLAYIIVNPGIIGNPLLALLFENNPQIQGLASLNWYIALLSIEGVVGTLFLISVLLLVRGHEARAIQTVIIGLILSLTLGHTLAFYFNQFSVVIDSLGLFIVLLTVIRYRDRFLRHKDIVIPGMMPWR